MIYKNTEVKILNQTKSLPKGSLKLFCLGVDGTVDLRSNDNLLKFLVFRYHPKKIPQKKTAKIIKVNWWLLLNLSNLVTLC